MVREVGDAELGLGSQCHWSFPPVKLGECVGFMLPAGRRRVRLSVCLTWPCPHVITVEWSEYGEWCRNPF